MRFFSFASTLLATCLLVTCGGQHDDIVGPPPLPPPPPAGCGNTGSGVCYHVATTGDDANPGTAALPFKTIQHAADIVNPGDGVLAKDVGSATGRNPLAVVVPCHRVVGKDGSLTGYAGGLKRKRYLLDLESAASPAAADRLF